MVLRVAPAQASMIEEHSQRQSAEDVIRQARISHHNSMALHINGASNSTAASVNKASLVRIQYDLGTNLPYDYVMKDIAGNPGLPAPVMPKTITIKTTPRFGAVMMAASASSAAANTPADGAVAAALELTSSDATGHGAPPGGPSGPPQDVDEGPASFRSTDYSEAGNRAGGPLGCVAEAPPALPGWSLAGRCASSTYQNQHQNQHQQGCHLGGGGSEVAAAAALRGRLRRMSATDAPTPPLLYTSRLIGPAASIDGGSTAKAGPSFTGSLGGTLAWGATGGRGTAAGGVAAIGGQASHGGTASPRDPWHAITVGLPAPRGCGSVDAAARARAASHLPYSSSDTGPTAGGAASWGTAFATPLIQQLEALGAGSDSRDLWPAATNEGPTSGRGRGLAARAPAARHSTTGAVGSAAAAAAGDAGAVVDEPLETTASLPGSVGNVPMPPHHHHHLPLQRRGNFQVSQLSPVEGFGGTRLRAMPHAPSSPLQSSPSCQPLLGSQVFGGAAPYGDDEGPCSAPPAPCYGASGFSGAGIGGTAAPPAASDAPIPRTLQRRPRQPHQLAAAAAPPPLVLPAGLAGVAALLEIAIPALPSEGAPASPLGRFAHSAYAGSGEPGGGSFAFGGGYGGAPPPARNATSSHAGDTIEARGGGNDNSDGGGGDSRQLVAVALGPGTESVGGLNSAASDAGCGGDREGHQALGSIASDNDSEAEEECASPFVFATEPATPPPPQSPLGSARAPARPNPTQTLPQRGSVCGGDGISVGVGAAASGVATVGFGGSLQIVVPPTHRGFRRVSAGEDRQTPPPPASPSALAVRQQAPPAAAAAQQQQPPLSPHHRGPYGYSNGPSLSSPLPSPYYFQKQQQQQHQQQMQQEAQQKQQTLRRRLAEHKQLSPAGAVAAAAASATSPAVGLPSPVEVEGCSPLSASPVGSCPDPGTPGAPPKQQRFLAPWDVISGAAKRRAERQADRAAAATAAKALPSLSSSSSSMSVAAAAAAGAHAPLTPPSGGGGGGNGVREGRGRRGSVEISADEHRDIVARMKAALSFLRRGE